MVARKRSLLRVRNDGEGAVSLREIRDEIAKRLKRPAGWSAFSLAGFTTSSFADALEDEGNATGTISNASVQVQVRTALIGSMNKEVANEASRLLLLSRESLAPPATNAVAATADLGTDMDETPIARLAAEWLSTFARLRRLVDSDALSMAGAHTAQPSVGDAPGANLRLPQLASLLRRERRRSAIRRRSTCSQFVPVRAADGPALLERWENARASGLPSDADSAPTVDAALQQLLSAWAGPVGGSGDGMQRVATDEHDDTQCNKFDDQDMGEPDLVPSVPRQADNQMLEHRGDEVDNIVGEACESSTAVEEADDDPIAALVSATLARKRHDAEFNRRQQELAEQLDRSEIIASVQEQMGESLVKPNPALAQCFGVPMPAHLQHVEAEGTSLAGRADFATPARSDGDESSSDDDFIQQRPSKSSFLARRASVIVISDGDESDHAGSTSRVVQRSTVQRDAGRSESPFECGELSSQGDSRGSGVLVNEQVDQNRPEPTQPSKTANASRRGASKAPAPLPRAILDFGSDFCGEMPLATAAPAGRRPFKLLAGQQERYLLPADQLASTPGPASGLLFTVAKNKCDRGGLESSTTLVFKLPSAAVDLRAEPPFAHLLSEDSGLHEWLERHRSRAMWRESRAVVAAAHLDSVCGSHARVDGIGIGADCGHSAADILCGSRVSIDNRGSRMGSISSHQDGRDALGVDSPSTGSAAPLVFISSTDRGRSDNTQRIEATDFQPLTGETAGFPNEYDDEFLDDEGCFSPANGARGDLLPCDDGGGWSSNGCDVGGTPVLDSGSPQSHGTLPQPGMHVPPSALPDKSPLAVSLKLPVTPTPRHTSLRQLGEWAAGRLAPVLSESELMEATCRASTVPNCAQVRFSELFAWHRADAAASAASDGTDGSTGSARADDNLVAPSAKRLFLSVLSLATGHNNTDGRERSDQPSSRLPSGRQLKLQNAAAGGAYDNENACDDMMIYLSSKEGLS